MESIEAFNALSGGVSEQTRLSVLAIIDDPHEEMEKMKEERQQERDESDANSYQDAFNSSEKVDEGNGRTI